MDDGVYELYVSTGSTASYAGKCEMLLAHTGWGSASRAIIVAAKSESEAWEKAAEMVIFAGWDGKPDVMSDSDYDELMETGDKQ